jgi:hypothetical protein
MEARFPKRHQCAKVEMLLNQQEKGASEMKITTIGLDLAKSIFQLNSVDERDAEAICEAVTRPNIWLQSLSISVKTE